MTPKTIAPQEFGGRGNCCSHPYKKADWLESGLEVDLDSDGGDNEVAAEAHAWRVYRGPASAPTESINLWVRKLNEDGQEQV